MRLVTGLMRTKRSRRSTPGTLDDNRGVAQRRSRRNPLRPSNQPSAVGSNPIRRSPVLHQYGLLVATTTKEARLSRWPNGLYQAEWTAALVGGSAGARRHQKACPAAPGAFGRLPASWRLARDRQSMERRHCHIGAVIRPDCLAEYAITDEEIASMAKGSDLTISVQNQNRKPAFTVTVPVTGFAAAYAKVR